MRAGCRSLVMASILACAAPGRAQETDRLIYAEASFPTTVDPITARTMVDKRMMQLFYNSVVMWLTNRGPVQEELGSMQLLNDGTELHLRVGWFALTDQSLAALKTNGVPDHVLKKLEAVKGARFTTAAELERRLEWTLSTDELAQYQAEILKLDLRRGLRWSDGTRVTADDVFRTMEVLLDPRTRPNGFPLEDYFPDRRLRPRARERSLTPRVIKEGPYHLMVTHAERFAYPRFVFCFKVLPKSLLKEGFLTADSGVLRHHDQTSLPKLYYAPAGTGPYQPPALREIKRMRRSVVFDRNPHFSLGEGPSIPKVELRVTQNAIDQFDNPIHVIPEADLREVQRWFRQGPELGTQIRCYRSFTFYYIGFNQREPEPGSARALFRKLEVRRAFADAFAPKKELVRRELCGAPENGFVLDGPFNPEDPVFDALQRVAPSERPSEDAIREVFTKYPGLKPAKLKLKFLKDYAVGAALERVAAIFQKHFEEAYGLDIEPVALEPREWAREIERQADFDFLLHRYSYGIDYDLSAFASSASSASANLCGFADSQVDKYLKSYKLETDEAFKRSSLEKIHTSLRDRAACIFLVAPRRVAVISGQVELPKKDPIHQYLFFNNVHQWRLRHHPRKTLR